MSELPAFRHTRLWWPDHLVDEVMPSGKLSPEAWLAPDENGVTTIRDDLDDEDRVMLTLSPGETVRFRWHEDRGEVDVLMLPDGTWKLDDERDGATIDMFRPHEPLQRKVVADLPFTQIAAANWFAWEQDWEVQACTLDKLVRSMVEDEPPEPEGTRITVEMGFWSGKIAWRVSADGRTLEPAEGGKADRPSEPLQGPSAASGEAATSEGHDDA